MGFGRQEVIAYPVCLSVFVFHFPILPKVVPFNIREGKPLPFRLKNKAFILKLIQGVERE
jgi:hypothetical protein